MPDYPEYSYPKSPEPTLEYLRDLKREQEAARGGTNQIDLELFDLYEQQNPVPVPDHMDIAADIMRGGMVTQVVDQCLGYYALSSPTFHMKPRKLGSREEARTSELEVWLNTTVIARIAEADDDFILSGLQDFFVYGHAGWVTLDAPSRWLDYPREKKEAESDDDYVARTENWKRQNPLPLISRRLAINTLEGNYESTAGMQKFKAGAYPVRVDGALREFLYVQTVKLRDIVARKKSEEDGYSKVDDVIKAYRMDMGTEIDLWTYYSNDHIAYFCDLRKGVDKQEDEYQMLEVFPHKLGEIPVVWLEGKTPHQFSLVYPMRKAASQLDRLLSQAATRHRLWGWPTPVLKLDPDLQGQSGRPQEIDVEPGKSLTLWKTEEIGEAFLDKDSALSDKLIALSIGAIERQSPTLSGFGGDSAESGYSLVSRFEISKSKLRPHELTLERALAKDARLCLKVLEVEGEPMPIYREPLDKQKEGEGWIVGDPKDVGGYYNVRASLRGIMPQDYPRNALAALQVTQPGSDGQPLMDRSWAREKLLDVPDSDQVDDRLMLQKMRTHPLYEATLMKQVFSEADEELDAADLEDALHKLNMPFEALPPALQLAIQENQRRGLSGMQMSPGGGNPAAEIAQQQVPGASVGADQGRTTLGQAGMA